MFIIKKNSLLLITLRLKALMSKIQSFDFKKIINVANNRDKFDDN